MSIKQWSLFHKPRGKQQSKQESKQRIGIKACGYCVPPHIRTNNDPIFHTIKRTENSQGVAEIDLFTGMKERHYLNEDEQVELLMAEAAKAALRLANLTSRDIDELYGYASVPEYYTPNGLYIVHRELDLPEQTLVVPINNEFSTFLISVMKACEAIGTGHSRNALVVCGCNWTRYMDYTQGHAFSIGDGAGAAIVGPDADFVLLDSATQTLSEQYGSMTMQTHNTPFPTYKIKEEEGIHTFQVSAMEGIPAMVQALLNKHGLTGSDIALITHQASRVLMDHWAERLQPREYLDTLAEFGNLTLASYPVSLAYHYLTITADYLLLAAIGVGYHQTALLLKRNGNPICFQVMHAEM